jgi:hypothetical protein
MLTFSYVLSDFPSFHIVKDIDIKKARIKIAMDITRGYIEDPRLENYQYFAGDAAQAGVTPMPTTLVAFDYNQFVCDLTNLDDDEEEDKDFIMAKTISHVESLQLKIKQDQDMYSELMYSANQNDNTKTTEEDNNTLLVVEKKKIELELEILSYEIKANKAKIYNNEIDREIKKKEGELKIIESKKSKALSELDVSVPSIQDEELVAKIRADLEKEIRDDLEKQIRDDLAKEHQIEADQRNERLAKQFKERDEHWNKKLMEKHTAWKIEKQKEVQAKEEALRKALQDNADLEEEKRKLLEQIETLRSTTSNNKGGKKGKK